ncbi:MAG: serine protease [Gammaproteobacteria bacterium]|nr:serine protease [Gammaproteobacteria bacterium]MXW45125.1 serine protease [Gammaproteobacteria bacterium]MYD01901.1 serine protease [Gammaproteobacteria bacterium]MYI26110.1 serine protease [Gammaproteobacteria bacterium]
MPIWSEILTELASTQEQGNPPDFDSVRRKYLAEMHRHTGRNIILYASGWLQKPDVPPAPVSISDEDMQALMEVSQGLAGDQLDLILHSPGGSPEAAEAIVSYLRQRFTHIRVIVPQLAMSAATMISCAANEIVLGKHSFLGPTDPQLLLQTSLGIRAVPAQAVLDQFDRATRECADPAKLSAWLPMLGQYGPDLLVQCELALAMSKELVKTWLESYMFEGLDDCVERAQSVSDWLAGHDNFKSHSRHIPRDEAEKRRLVVYRLETDEVLQDLALSVFHATTHTFSGTPAVKIVESHTGRAFVKQHVVQAVPAVQFGLVPSGPDVVVPPANVE